MIVNNLFIFYLFYLYVISERSNNAAVFQSKLICCGDLLNYQGFREAKGEVRLRRCGPEWKKNRQSRRDLVVGVLVQSRISNRSKHKVRIQFDRRSRNSRRRAQETTQQEEKAQYIYVASAAKRESIIANCKLLRLLAF